uniref:Glutathione S-transferase C-terminal domain-containing protein n=1 Tax=Timema genevievae TaxID=629358 RepID=A0A7R9KA09_TIMGE|nr:unnamed protein product [Timema genevievae]
MERTLNKIEDVWLAGDKPYLTGERISIADLLAACEVEQTPKSKPTFVSEASDILTRDQGEALVDVEFLSG